MFRPYTIAYSGWQDRRGVQTFTDKHSASSSDHLGDAITSKMNVLLLFPSRLNVVFLTFPTIPIACSILHTDCTGSPVLLLRTATFSNFSLYMLSSALFTFPSPAGMPLYISLSIELPVLLLLSSLTTVTKLQCLSVGLSVHIQETQASCQCQS